MSKRQLCAGTAVGLLLLLAACELEGPKEPKPIPDGTAAVTVAIQAPGTRTVLLQVQVSDAGFWQLWGRKPADPSETLLGWWNPPYTGTVYFDPGP